MRLLEMSRRSSRWVSIAVAMLSGAALRLLGDSVVVFNEVHYHPPGDEAALEWVELHNPMAVDVDISGWSLADGVRFAFPEGTVVPGGGFLVVASSPEALKASAGVESALGPFEGRLENAGERLELRDRNHRLMDALSYRDREPWPPAADGSGATLAKVDAGGASAPADNWAPSAALGGTPAAANFESPAAARPAAALAFNESVVAAAEAWIELINASSAPIALAGHAVRSSSGAGAELVFAEGSLEPGARLALAPEALGFGLAGGDKLFLLPPGRDRVLDAVALEEGSRARWPEGRGPWHAPEAATRGAENRVRAQRDIVINEIFYHARPTLSDPGSFEDAALLPFSGEWRYEPSGQDLGDAWRAPDFDDSAWPVGRGLFYNETADLPAQKQTPLALGPMTFYFRGGFDFDGDPAAAKLKIRLIVDDGAIVYLNGVEAARFQMPGGAITAATPAARTISNARLSVPIDLPVGPLRRGRNALAVEVHQSAADSDDVAFGLEVLETRTLSAPRDFAESAEEWVELYNRGGQEIDLGGWRFSNGIEHVFEPGVKIGPGEHLVVAGDREALQAKHPEIRIAGDFQGALSNRGDRLVLADAFGNVADEVRYFDRGRWHGFADGFGSSLELRDPRADNSSAEAWAASDEGARSAWKSYSYSGAAAANIGPTQWSEFVFGLFDAGELLLDDLSVIENPGGVERELVQNSGFEAGDSSWRYLGTHRLTRTIEDPDRPGNHVLHLIATGATEHMHNHVETTLANRLRVQNGMVYRISFRARWLAGSNQLHTRLYFNRMPRTTIIDAPAGGGTPGRRNSRFEENIGPTYERFAHAPLLPAADEAVAVSVAASDPDGVASVTLRWSLDRRSWSSAPMALGGDGRWSAGIPWQGNANVLFYIEGEDGRGARSTYPPAGAEGGALFAPRDNQLQTQVHTLRIVMAPDSAALLHENTNLMSNASVPATVFLNDARAYYDVGVRLRGSERGRPDDTRLSFHITLHPDELFRGVHGTIALDRSGGWSGLVPRGSQDEIVIKHAANHAGGIPMMYDDIAHVIAPRRQHTGRALLMMGRYTNVYLDSQFENGSDGTKFTYELIYYPTTTAVNGNPETPKRPLPDEVTGTDHADLGPDKEVYRWNYLIENNVQRDDYAGLMRFTKALGLTGAALDAATQEALDVDQWLRAFALYSLCGVGDTYMSGNLHNNIYYVRPSDGRVMVFPWDMDFAFVNASSGPLVWDQHNFRKVLQLPANTRRFYRHALDILDSTYNRDYMTRWTAHYGQKDGRDFAAILSYIVQRERAARTQIPRAVPFAITTNGGEDLAVAEASAVVDGTAWIDVAAILVQERPEGVAFTWPAITRWRAALDLEPGVNPLTFFAFDGEGALLYTDSIRITSGSAERFIRGDANLDGRVNTADAVAVLFQLFRAQPIPCADAADLNDDEALNLTDAVYLLEFLFRQGPRPPAPFPAAGPDAGGGAALGCERGLTR